MNFSFSLDDSGLGALNSLALLNPFLDNFFIFSAKYLIFFVFAGVLFFLIKKNIRLVLTAYLGAVIGRLILIPIIRLFYFRPRPFINGEINQLISHNPAEASFPSGHTTIMFAISFAVFAYNRKLGSVFLIVSFWSTVSRIIVGVHFPLDIVGGIIVGFISYKISSWIVKSCNYSKFMRFSIWF